ncbi:MAG: chorismate-binding protein [Oligoflexus sp.]
MISELKNSLKAYPGSIRRVGRDIKLESFLKVIPEQSPVLAWGGRQSRFAYLALELEEKPLADALAEPLGKHLHHSNGKAQSCQEQAFLGGWVGVNSYDDYAPQPSQSPSSRIFWVNRLLVFDQVHGEIYEACLDAKARAPYQLNGQRLAELALNRQERKKNLHQWLWQAKQSQKHYLTLVENCLNDIRRGRYYQINLLCYFELLSQPDFCDWMERWSQYAGPFSSLLRLPGDCEIYSFSPERFVSFYPGQNGLEILTEPIKGTMPVYAEEAKNRWAMQQLQGSAKDRAELHMIVDLLRNDLFRICRPASVHVSDPGTIHSFKNVHHLIAKITGSLRSDLTLGSMLQALCPGGSITGAPKIEVMKAIQTYEGRSRGFFMGNFFFWAPNQSFFDSSILIRTAQRLANGPMEFAAGSGLVIRSDPQQEFIEIQAKSRVLIDAEKSLGT